MNVPEVLAWDEATGFMLLTDLGAKTMMQVINPDDPRSQFDLYMQAVDALIAWQLASKPGVLPPYDEALLRRELALFPDWYLAKHRQVTLDAAQQATLDKAFNLIVQRNLAVPSVYVHRDFMPRNLMVGGHGATRKLGRAGLSGRRLRPHHLRHRQPDARCVFELGRGVCPRHHRPLLAKGRKVGLLGPTARPVGAHDFGEFYRAVEWMGLQRHLKILGIFARLTLRDGKPKYLADTPRFIAYIRATADRYREFGTIFEAAGPDRRH